MAFSGLLWWLSSKEPVCNAGDTEDMGSVPDLGKILWSRKWEPTPVFLSGKSQGQRNLLGCSPGGCEESDMTEHARTHIIIIQLWKWSQAANFEYNQARENF